MKVEKGVRDGSGVFVSRGVAVKVTVGVNVGRAVRVCMEAASDVCLMKRLTLFGSSVASGTGVAGTQARIAARAMNQIKNFFPREGILSLEISM